MLTTSSFMKVTKLIFIHVNLMVYHAWINGHKKRQWQLRRAFETWFDLFIAYTSLHSQILRPDFTHFEIFSKLKSSLGLNLTRTKMAIFDSRIEGCFWVFHKNLPIRCFKVFLRASNGFWILTVFLQMVSVQRMQILVLLHIFNYTKSGHPVCNYY